MNPTYEAADVLLAADEAEELDAWTLEELDDAEVVSRLNSPE